MPILHVRIFEIAIDAHALRIRSVTSRVDVDAALQLSGSQGWGLIRPTFGRVDRGRKVQIRSSFDS